MERLRAKIEREGLTDERSEGLRLLRQSADGHNRIRRRGVPIIGRAGVGGATPGSDPVAALLRTEGRGELRR